MFSCLVGIDIENNVDPVKNELRGFSSSGVRFFPSVEALFESDTDLPKVDGLLISIYSPLSSEAIQKLSGLRYVGILGTSTAKVDQKALSERKIHLDNVTGYCDLQTAEWVVLTLLNFLRGNLPIGKKTLASSLEHKTVGIIGAGSVGSLVGRMMRVFSARVLFSSRRPNFELANLGANPADVHTIFEKADLISIHTPPFLEWLGQEHLHLMKPNAVLVNTCMGKISLNDDLEEALLHREMYLIMDRVAGKSYPLKNSSRVFIDGQCAYDTEESRKNLLRQFAAHIADFLKKP